MTKPKTKPQVSRLIFFLNTKSTVMSKRCHSTNSNTHPKRTRKPGRSSRSPSETVAENSAPKIITLSRLSERDKSGQKSALGLAPGRSYPEFNSFTHIDHGSLAPRKQKPAIFRRFHTLKQRDEKYRIYNPAPAKSLASRQPMFSRQLKIRRSVRSAATRLSGDVLQLGFQRLSRYKFWSATASASIPVN